MKKKKVSINYTNRDFATIKQDLINHAKRYYPDTYKDFNEASFGSLMIDTVSYIGDILSFYLDYQANESFLDSAVEYDNVQRLARQQDTNSQIIRLLRESWTFISLYQQILSVQVQT